MADLLIAGTGGLGRVAANMAKASGRWSAIAFLAVADGRSETRAAIDGSASRDGGTATGERTARTVDPGPGSGDPGGPGREPDDGDRHGRTDAEAAPDDRCAEWPIVGSTRSARDLTQQFSDLFVAVPGNQARASALRRMASLGFFLPCLVHPSAAVCKSARMDYGCLISAQSTVEPDAQLGIGSIIGPGATVGYGCAFGLAVHVAAGAHLGAGVRVGGHAWIGIGAIVTEGVSIGTGVTVAAGAVVTEDIADGVHVYGSPAAILPSSLPAPTARR